jgi:hypothetical protein
MLTRRRLFQSCSGLQHRAHGRKLAIGAAWLKRLDKNGKRNTMDFSEKNRPRKDLSDIVVRLS